MKLSSQSEYALLSLIHLARANSLLSVETIAAHQRMPLELLREILSVLSRFEYLNQVDDGFELAKDAGEISVAEIIRLFDGALAPFEPVSSKGYQSAPMDHEVKLSGLFEKIRQLAAARLESATIAELA